MGGQFVHKLPIPFFSDDSVNDSESNQSNPARDIFHENVHIDRVLGISKEKKALRRTEKKPLTNRGFKKVFQPRLFEKRLEVCK